MFATFLLKQLKDPIEFPGLLVDALTAKRIEDIGNGRYAPVNMDVITLNTAGVTTPVPFL